MCVWFPMAAIAHSRCAWVSGARGQEGRWRRAQLPGAPQVHSRAMGKTNDWAAPPSLRLSLCPCWTPGVDGEVGWSCPGPGRGFGVVLLGWAGLSFHESSLQELTSWIQGAVPRKPFPARNPTHYLVLKGRHRSFLGPALCNSLARRAPDEAPPEPTQLHRSPCIAGVWYPAADVH